MGSKKRVNLDGKKRKEPISSRKSLRKSEKKKVMLPERKIAKESLFAQLGGREPYLAETSS